MKKRDGDAWMSPGDYGRSLNGIGFNLLYPDLERAVAFQRDVLRADIVYADPDFVAVKGFGSSWMLHADHTYDDHPLSGIARGLEGRGGSVELRVYGCDPDAAELAARDLGFTVLAGAMDKPHGIREAFIIDDAGYIWVPGVGIDDI